MTLARRLLSRGASIGIVVLLLAGCGLIPRPAESIDELAGEWVFIDPDGVTSTLVIEESGRFTVDRAPEEAFRTGGGETDLLFDWDRTVDWDKAQPASGVARIGITGDVRFSTKDPKWGGSAAYQNPMNQSLSFGIGDADNQDWIRYVRVDEG